MTGSTSGVTFERFLAKCVMSDVTLVSVTFFNVTSSVFNMISSVFNVTSSEVTLVNVTFLNVTSSLGMS